MPAATERLRDFCGLDQGNLMRVAAEVRKLVSSQTPGNRVASAAEVHTWMVNPENIHWGLYHVPSLRAVSDLLRHWDSLKKIPGALALIDRAKCEFGRDNLFEWPTKLANILEKAPQQLVTYIMESLLAFMLRNKTSDPFSAMELKKEKGGVIEILLWQRRYLWQLHQEYSEMFEVVCKKNN